MKILPVDVHGLAGDKHAQGFEGESARVSPDEKEPATKPAAAKPAPKKK